MAVIHALPKDDAGTLAEHAYRRLRAEILHGTLMPGERLRAADLNGRFALGLTPIREALGRLAAEELVTFETHRGSRVSAMSLTELADLMATRRAIEHLCLTAAIARGDAAWEAEIVAALHLLSRTPLPGNDRGASERGAEAAMWETHHRRFHAALVRACDSAWLLRFWNQLADHSERYRKIRLLRHAETAADVRDIPGEHRAIAEAALARDAGRATALMDAHLRATENAVARLLSSEVV